MEKNRCMNREQGEARYCNCCIRLCRGRQQLLHVYSTNSYSSHESTVVLGARCMLCMLRLSLRVIHHVPFVSSKLASFFALSFRAFFPFCKHHVNERNSRC